MDAQLEAKRQEIATTRLQALTAARTVGSQLPLTASSCDPSLVIEALYTTNRFRHVAIALAHEMQSPVEGDFEFELTDDHRVFLAEVVKVLQHPQAQQRFDRLDLHWRALLIEAFTMAEAAKQKNGVDSVQLPPILAVDQTTSNMPRSEGDKVRRGYAALFQLDKTAVKKGDMRTIDAIALPLATATEAWMRAVIPIASEMCTFFESSTRSRNSSKTSLPTLIRSPSSAAAKPGTTSTPSRKRATREVIQGVSVERKAETDVVGEAEPRSVKASKKDTEDHLAHSRVHDKSLPQESQHEARVEQADSNVDVDDDDDDEKMMPSTQPPLPPARSRILNRLQAAAQQQAAKFEAPVSTSSNSNTAVPSSAGPALSARPLAQGPQLSTTSEHRKVETTAFKRDGLPAVPKAPTKVVVSPPKRPGATVQRVVEENVSSLEQHSSGSGGTSGSSCTYQPSPPAQTLRTPPVSTSSSNAAYVSATDDPTSSFESTPLVLNTQSTTPSSAEERENSQFQPTLSGSKDGRSQTSTQNTDSLEYVDDVAAHKRRFEEQQRLKAAAEAKNIPPPIQNGAGAVGGSGREGAADVQAQGNDDEDNLGISDTMSDDEDSISSHLVPHRRFDELEAEATQGPDDDVTMDELLSNRVSPFF
ncbi:BQ2448_865 [Microbotryum intermedium]|uniref:BQ2448_865 protein n=1 Tax=Microbotryum intermedium TaxID=269621 RepID=A0A238FA43_9BASI|nr:BQ2448_865 [Microbotryum intermedium]